MSANAALKALLYPKNKIPRVIILKVKVPHPFDSAQGRLSRRECGKDGATAPPITLMTMNCRSLALLGMTSLCNFVVRRNRNGLRKGGHLER